MKNKRLLTLVGSVCLILVLAALPFMAACPAPPPPEEEKPIELSWADSVPGGIWYYDEVILPFFDMVEQRSNGRIKITGYPGGTLCQQGAILSGVKSGIADMGREEDVYVSGVLPMCEVMGLGGVPYNCSAVAIHAKWETYKALEPKGAFQELSDVHVLYIGTAVPECLMSQRPVRSLEDIQHMEVWARGKAGTFAKALGFVPVDLTYAELYDGLAKGVIQGAITAPTLLQVFLLADHTDYLTFTHFMSTTTTPYFMNLDKWNSLPKDLQKIITESAEFFVEYETNTFDRYQLDGIRYAMQVKPEWENIYLSDEEEARWVALVRAVSQEELAKFEAQGLPAQMVYEELLRQVEKYNAIYPPLK